jgi:iron complex outermembrane receptor protein
MKTRFTKINTLPSKIMLIALFLTCGGLCSSLSAQIILKGQVLDRTSSEPLIGASVVISGTTTGEITDLDGKFNLEIPSFPVNLTVAYMGYVAQELTISSDADKLKFKLVSQNFNLEAFEVTASRISDQQKEAALTIESMDILAIKETPAANFYEGLGALKGVDLTSASIGFKVINTRGFNSTSPVRSLQIIDGVDNQAPGLNFSLGNFLGASELDVMKVDLVQGASSAFYGPNAFNGVISMTTKDPFMFPGVSVQAKVGERNMMEGAVRYAQVFKNKDSVDKFAFKFNLFYLQANDWEATNLDAVQGSEVGADNWGGYDAVNRYGDENPIYFNSLGLQANQPGLGILHRDGYMEGDIVDYNTQNLKTSLALHYKVNKTDQLIYSFNFGTGTTVYQGDNRYSLKDILFFQNRLEYKTKKGFIRAYTTAEDAGNSYDAVFTALLLQDSVKSDARWAQDYFGVWSSLYAPQVEALPGWPQQILNPGPPPTVSFDFDLAQQIMAMYSDQMGAWHQLTRDSVNLAGTGGLNIDGDINRLIPGTPEFEAALKDITSRESYAEGGSRFYDKSSLYHLHGERHWDLDTAAQFKLITGANGRLYTPTSRGTIFSDTGNVTITNYEVGGYAGLERRFFENQKLKGAITVRADKNENFNLVVSPAASAVYNLDKKTVLRASFSSALRNPTLQDQFLYYNVGRAILIGNIAGYDSLITVESAREYASTQDTASLDYFDVAPIQPEKVKTVEVGIRTTLSDRIYIDASYYYSFYTDFIGYNIGVDPYFDPTTNSFVPGKTQAYRIAANATSLITTQGFSIGSNYYFKKFITINANYSWNKLNLEGTDDPIVPAFNTPEHKFNVGFSGRDINTYFKLSKKEDARSIGINNFGFSVNYKWVEGFLFEGSPQFTGFVPSYDALDMQINKYFPKIKSTFKLGASNLLNNMAYQVYGGPRVGRLAYFSILVEPSRKN